MTAMTGALSWPTTAKNYAAHHVEQAFEKAVSGGVEQVEVAIDQRRDCDGKRFCVVEHVQPCARCKHCSGKDGKPARRCGESGEKAHNSQCYSEGEQIP